MDLRSRFRGCLLGGAVGDALGYPVEFLSLEEIRGRFGPKGITRPLTNGAAALISDDTQMTLFTANGLLLAATQSSHGNRTRATEEYIHRAYLDWLSTQGHRLAESVCWLHGLGELHSLRAPGNTCLSALASGEMGTLEQPINNSKGCGGVMRVAPIGLLYPPDETMSRRDIDLLGARAAAITHGHPLGFLPAAALVHMVGALTYGGEEGASGLRLAAESAVAALGAQFPHYGETGALTSLLRRAMALSQSAVPEDEAIKELGAGWVAEETLAISLYCCLRYPDNFAAAVAAAVNHSGDSDSTGAVAGNLLGAHLGLERIPSEWRRCVELADVVLELADDLYQAATGSAVCASRPWTEKYAGGRG